MKQGTISLICGCHNIIIHPILVLISWYKLYHKIPEFWQIICIFLHDIGHWGLDYLDNLDEKKKHWELGAKIAGKLFGNKGFYFVAGHCEYSGYLESKLYKPDKYSWYIAPKLWLFLNTFTEPKLGMGYSHWEAVYKFKKQVKESIESGEFKSTHNFYLERCNNE